MTAFRKYNLVQKGIKIVDSSFRQTFIPGKKWLAKRFDTVLVLVGTVTTKEGLDIRFRNDNGTLFMNVPLAVIKNGSFVQLN